MEERAIELDEENTLGKLKLSLKVNKITNSEKIIINKNNWLFII
jgi:hypothetical protein